MTDLQYLVPLGEPHSLGTTSWLHRGYKYPGGIPSSQPQSQAKLRLLLKIHKAGV